jgi:hypothetical protein
MPDPEMREQPRSRPPIFTLATYALPAMGIPCVIAWVKQAEQADRHSFMPGLGEAVIGFLSLALIAAACSTAAFLLHERWRFATLPALLASSVVLFLAVARFFNL